MATIHMSDVDDSCDLSSLLARVRHGEEIVFKEGNSTVAVLHAPIPARHEMETAAESNGIMDAEFARDVQAGIDSMRQPLVMAEWP